MQSLFDMSNENGCRFSWLLLLSPFREELESEEDSEQLDESGEVRLLERVSKSFMFSSVL